MYAIRSYYGALSFGLPLDVAAHARDLLRADRSAFEDRVDRRAQGRAGDRLAVAGATVVELAAVDEPELANPVGFPRVPLA